ncbi:MAG: DUF4129 domain-containing protein [Acidimicrobiia bacterium]
MSGALTRVDPDAARRAARDIVGSRRFRPEEVPKPLEGVLQWIGDRLEPLGDVFGAIADFFSHGVGLALFLALLVAVVAGAAFLIARGRASRAARFVRGSKRAEAARLDPDQLERDATEAEAAGDLDRAIRLRFRAGLLRLDGVGAIRYRPSLTSTQVARTLRSRDFEELVSTFDAIVYGGRPADSIDLVDARARWPRVLAEARKP